MLGLGVRLDLSYYIYSILSLESSKQILKNALVYLADITLVLFIACTISQAALLCGQGTSKKYHLLSLHISLELVTRGWRLETPKSCHHKLESANCANFYEK